MQQAATTEMKEIRIMLSMIVLATLVVLFGISLKMPITSPSVAAYDQQPARTQPDLQGAMTFTSGSERYRAEACVGQYACDEEGTPSTEMRSRLRTKAN